MKKISLTLLIIVASIVFTIVYAQKIFTAEGHDISKKGKTGQVKAEQISGNKRILTVYFSHTGNTREIANQIHRAVGGDIFEIRTVQTYPGAYDEVVKQAKQEKESGYKPALKEKIRDIGSYDVVFVGYPNWWGTMPMPVVTFLSEHDLSGKTIVPFCTHEGSGMGRSVADIKKLSPKSTVLEGLPVRGSYAKRAQEDVTKWLREIRIIK
jgi:flavodoxin